jgi:hypothetical protein
MMVVRPTPSGVELFHLKNIYPTEKEGFVKGHNCFFLPALFLAETLIPFF